MDEDEKELERGKGESEVVPVKKEVMMRHRMRKVGGGMKVAHLERWNCWKEGRERIKCGHGSNSIIII